MIRTTQDTRRYGAVAMARRHTLKDGAHILGRVQARPDCWLVLVHYEDVSMFDFPYGVAIANDYGAIRETSDSRKACTLYGDFGQAMQKYESIRQLIKK